MEFQSDYFLAEDRLGHHITSMMKRYWAAGQEVLIELNRVCKELGIVYYADYGTLLGAVRHKGFIPWDDDIDISMTRGDYEKFRAEAPTLLQYGMTLYNNCKTALAPMRLVNTIGPQIDSAFLERYHGCPYSVGIDIYVLDKIPEKRADDEKFIALQNCIKYLAQRFDRTFMSEEEHHARYDNDGHTDESIEEMIKNVEATTGAEIDRSGNMAVQMTVLLNAIQGLYWDTDVDELVYMHGWCRHGRKPMSYSCYGEPVWLPFENTEIMCPKEYRLILEERFGSDYMTPKQEAASHGKVAYANSQKILLDTFAKCGIEPPAEYLE